eukprot:535241_1
MRSTMSNKLPFLCVIIFITQNANTYEINCTTINRCDPIDCPPNEPCTVNCFGSSQPQDACSNTEVHCRDNYPCTVNCIQGQGCWGLKIFCPRDSVCNVNAPYGQQYRAMAWMEIYGGTNGILNVRNDVDDGMELGTIICPTNGDCNIYSNNIAHDASSSHIFMDIKVNATLSNHLNITLQGYNNPLLFGTIYCPMQMPYPAQPNCVVSVSDGNDSSVTRLLYRSTSIFTNEYTNLYLTTSADTCERCTVQLYLGCVDHRYWCDAILVNGTDDEWQCINKSKSTQCTHPTTTSIPTTVIITSSVLITTDIDASHALSQIWSIIAVIAVSAICCIIKDEIAKFPKIPGAISSNITTTNTTQNPGASVPIIGSNSHNLVASNVVPHKMSVQMEGVNTQGILCTKCTTLINDGQMTVRNGMFLCEECIIITDYGSDTNHSISDMYGTLKGTQGETKGTFSLSNKKHGHYADLPDKATTQYGTCLECGDRKVCKVDEDGSFFCNRCWDNNCEVDTAGHIS